MDVDVFQRRGEGREQLVGQRVEKQTPDEGHVTGSGGVDRVATGFCQNRVGCPAVILRWNPLGKAALAQSPQLMRGAAAFPTDQGREVRDLQAPAGCEVNAFRTW